MYGITATDYRLVVGLVRLLDRVNELLTCTCEDSYLITMTVVIVASVSSLLSHGLFLDSVFRVGRGSLFSTYPVQLPSVKCHLFRFLKL